MKLRPRISFKGRGLRRYAGLALLLIPFFLLISVFDRNEVKKALSRPYWERALGERVKRVPPHRRKREKPDDIGAGTIEGLPLYRLYIKSNTLAELDDLIPSKKDHEPYLGILPQAARLYKPADFEYNGRTWPVRIRLRGDNPIHWAAKKQSWRVKFPKESPFNGARRIDLINPKAANLITDYLAYWLAERMGLPAPKIRFVNLEINNRLMGVYQETEHIDKYFLENHGMPVGNIYGEKDKEPSWFGAYPIYDDVVFWRKHCDNENQAPDDFTEMAALITVLNDPSDDRFIKDIFNTLDREKFYRWNCHALLCSSGHQDWFHNARLYFNPVRGLFEFIPWDLSGFWLTRSYFFDTPRNVLGRLQYNPLSSRVLAHGPFRLERNRLLWGFVKDPLFLEELLKEAELTRSTIRAAVYNDAMKETIGQWPNRAAFTDKQFEDSVEELKKVTRTTFNRIREALEFNDLAAEFQVLDPRGGGDHLGGAIAKIGLVNTASSAAALTGVTLPVTPKAPGRPTGNVELSLYEDSNGNGALDAPDRAVADFTWNPEAKYFTCGGFKSLIYPDLNDKLQPVLTRRNYFIVRAAGGGTPPLDADKAVLSAANGVTDEPMEVSVQVVDERRLGMEIPSPATAKEFRALYPGIRCSIVGLSTIVLDRGNHRIDETIVVPAGATLEIPPGTSLEFSPGRSLLCYGSLEARGTAREPIRFTAADLRNGWGVIALWRSGANGSVLVHCIIEYGGEARLQGGYFSGALSAYYASVEVEDCIFRKNRGDDAVNCKNADGFIRRCIFSDNAADAIDFDYCKGLIADNLIHLNGNDGIDCGTASPLISGNVISDCGDKGISLGERSQPLVFNNVIRGCTIGIASKDMSDPVIANNVIVDNKTGIALYRKKSFFPGGGGATVINSVVWGGAKRITKDSLSDYSVEHCSIEGGYHGEGNVSVRPSFIDPLKGDYMATSRSPLARAGTDPGERARGILRLSGETFPIGLAVPLAVPREGLSR